MDRKRVVIMGAAGRDFHDFNVVFRDDPATHVVAFTAAQIPGIDERIYPPSLAGPRYPAGIPIRPEDELTELVHAEGVDEVGREAEPREGRAHRGSARFRRRDRKPLLRWADSRCCTNGFGNDAKDGDED